jgi:hypothetical protein
VKTKAPQHFRAGHPFATLKMRMGATHFLMKRLPNVATEMALNVLSYNLTRVLNILGVEPLLAAMRREAWAADSMATPTAALRCMEVMRTAFLHSLDPQRTKALGNVHDNRTRSSWTGHGRGA